MLVHRRVTPPQYVAGTHFYTWVKRNKMGLSFLSWETSQLARLEPRTFRSRVWGVKRSATNASLKPYSTGIIHNLLKVCSPLFFCKFVKMSVCFKCNWPAIFSTWADGREWEFNAEVQGVKMFRTIFKSIIPGSQLLHKVLLWKDWTRQGSILSLPHCLGQVQLSALPRIASWCDGSHKDEPIKTLTDILE